MHRPGLREVLAGGVVSATLILVGCGGGGEANADNQDLSGIKNSNISSAQTSPTPRPEAKITISDNAFAPAQLTVKAGTKVVWEWGGSNPHSIMLAGQDSGQKTGSGTYERTFDTPGSSFPYQCGVHGASMSGRIVVE